MYVVSSHYNGTFLLLWVPVHGSHDLAVKAFPHSSSASATSSGPGLVNRSFTRKRQQTVTAGRSLAECGLSLDLWETLPSLNVRQIRNNKDARQLRGVGCVRISEVTFQELGQWFWRFRCIRQINPTLLFLCRKWWQSSDKGGNNWAQKGGRNQNN